MIRLTCFIFLTPFSGLPQTIENFSIAFIDEKVVIQYDLLSSNPTDKYAVVFFSSHDDYASPIGEVTGDVGRNIEPLRDRVAIWNARAILRHDFDSSLTVKMKVRKESGYINLAFLPLNKRSFRRRKYISFQWKGGDPHDPVDIELLRNNKKVAVIQNDISNSKTFSWKLPAKLKTGGGYVLQLRGYGDVTKSDVFQIKPRTPFIVKALPLLCGGAVLGYLLTRPEELDPLPSPIEPE